MKGNRVSRYGNVPYTPAFGAYMRTPLIVRLPFVYAFSLLAMPPSGELNVDGIIMAK